MVLDSLGKSLDSLIRKIRRLPEIDKDTINAILQELQRALLMADVKVEICLQVTDAIKKQAMDQRINTQIDRKEFIIKLLHDQLIEILGGKEAPKRIKTGKQSVIMLVGIQGSGKTTTVGKLANYYKKRGFKVGAICTDTWRPGAYDQMAQTMDSIGVPHFGMPKEKNAIKIAKKGMKHFLQAKGKDKRDLIIVDTAGRHKQETDLMNEMVKLESVIKPNETLLVIDGTLGQQAYSQAKAFAESTHVGSIIITKLDGSAKGGGALSAAAAAKAPIKFIGVGERVDDLEPFDPTKFVGNLMGIPDIEGLLEKIEELGIDEEDQEDMAKRIKKGKFTLTDMYMQLQSIQKMGGVKKIIGMLGGQNLPDQFKIAATANMEKIKVMLQSMTQEEKDDPIIIKKTRISRISKGSGTSYTDVKKLLDQWRQMNRVMKNMFGKKVRGKKGATPNIPGMENLGDLSGGLPKGMDINQLQQMMAQGQKKKRKKYLW
ncbi:MAG: signal recognition particle protein [Promethearchaeia archaeon]|nr:MAG: signal recognition particle protein [Candidatus Lokiarchaeia archaeon]